MRNRCERPFGKGAGHALSLNGIGVRRCNTHRNQGGGEARPTVGAATAPSSHLMSDATWTFTI
ncbi:MAG TPA: hypothetical protein VII39_12540, partial [Bradyrhizobium sp.]